MKTKMRRARRKPNAARLSGFKGAEVSLALASKGLRNLSDDVDRQLDSKSLTEEQKINLRAAGYKIPED